VPLAGVPLRCPHCAGLARPDVVWFGEPLDLEVLTEARRAARCDLFLTIGTSAVVYPAAGLVPEAHAHGAYTVEVNVDATGASETVDLALRGKAEEILDAVERLLT